MLCLPTGVILTPRKKDKNYALLTNGVLRKHLAREYAVAVFAGAWGSKFICFDVDDGDAETVRRLLCCLEAFGFPRERIYVSISGGKGYHVEIFFDKLAATAQLLKVYRWATAKEGFDPRKVEFRPTNTMAIKLPLSVHARTGKICWYVDRETLTPIEREDYLMEIEPVSADLLTELIARNIHGEVSREGQQTQDEKAQPTKSHCGGRATEETRNLGTTLTEDGTRHNMMRNIAVYSRCHGMTADECRKELTAWYERQDKSLVKSTCEQVLADMDNLVAWVYSDRFQVNYAQPKGEVALNETDIRLVLSQRSRSARRIVSASGAMQGFSVQNKL